jgi:hypothetical protein
MPRDFDPIRSRIRDILLCEWDPSNAARSEYAKGEYDADVEPIYELIRRGAGEERVIDYLMDRQREIMCFPGLDRGPLRRVAGMLVGLRAEIPQD